MQSVANNPLTEWDDETLKRRFSNTYADIHCHGLTDGIDARAKLKLMELELKTRGFNPADHIGPRVISAD